MASLKNLKVVRLEPNVPAEFRKLLPTVHVREAIQFELHGVSAAVANAYRRVIHMEFPVKSFNVTLSMIETDDPDIIHEMVARRFCLLPISQGISLDSQFLIDVTNRTAQTIEVKSSEIKSLGKGPKNIVNETFTLFTLLPGRRFRCEFGVHEITGRDFGGSTIGGAVSSVPLEPVYNTYIEGLSDGPRPVSQTNYLNWVLKFTTNGTISAKDILTRASKIIEDRLITAAEITPAINSGELIADLPGENATIGNLIMRAAIEMFPECTCTYNDIVADGLCRIHVIDNDPERVYTESIAAMAELIANIRSQI